MNKLDDYLCKHHDTFIIAYCPDSDSFFVTDQRAFYWEHQEEFTTEMQAVDFFTSNINYFIDQRNIIFLKCCPYSHKETKVFLENTKQWYKI